MKYLDIRHGLRDDAITQTVDVLRKGGVIAAPTETVYGLMTLWDNRLGRGRIFEMKQRPRQKHLQMLAASLDQAVLLGVRTSPGLMRLAEAFWPGPLTVVCPTVSGSTVGLRIPRHEGLLAILRRLDSPLAATSANRSGMPPAADGRTAVEHLTGMPDLLLDAGGLPESAGVASTVIDSTGKVPKLLRQGPVDLAQIICVWHGKE